LLPGASITEPAAPKATNRWYPPNRCHPPFQSVPPTFSIGATHRLKPHLLTGLIIPEASCFPALASPSRQHQKQLIAGTPPIGATHLFNRCHPPFQSVPSTFSIGATHQLRTPTEGKHPKRTGLKAALAKNVAANPESYQPLGEAGEQLSTAEKISLAFPKQRYPSSFASICPARRIAPTTGSSMTNGIAPG